MTVIRIEGSKSQGRRKATTFLGAAVGSFFGATEFGAGLGRLAGNLITGSPPKPVEIDTDTNKLVVLDKRGNPVDSETARLLQQVWDTGSVPSNLRQKYWSTAQEIWRQRFEFRTPGGAYYPAPEEPAPQVTEGAQYTGANSMIGIVPPGGFAGFAGMTPASKMAMKVKNFGGTIGIKRRRKKRKAKGSTKRRKRASGGKRGRARLVKGSAAAKRYMASIRRKRKSG